MNTPQNTQESNLVSLSLSADLLDDLPENEIEIIRLQENLLSDLREDKRRLTNKCDGMVKTVSEARLELIEKDLELDGLTAKIASLSDEKAELLLMVGDSVTKAEHRKTIDELDGLSVSLTVANEMAKTLNKQKAALERQLADAIYKQSMAVSEYTENQDEFNRLQGQCRQLSSQLNALTDDNESLRKENKHQAKEIAGFKTRLDNACAAAVKQYADSHRPEPQKIIEADPAIAQKLQEKTLALLEIERENASLTALVNELTASLESQTTLNRSLAESNQIADQLVNTIKADMVELNRKMNECDNFAKQCAEYTAVSHQQCLEEKTRADVCELYAGLLNGDPLVISENGSMIFWLTKEVKYQFFGGRVTSSYKTDPAYPIMFLLRPDGVGFPVGVSTDHSELIAVTKEPQEIPADAIKPAIDAILELTKRARLDDLQEARNRFRLLCQKAAWFDKNLVDSKVELGEFLADAIEHKMITKEDLLRQSHVNNVFNKALNDYKARKRLAQMQQTRKPKGDKAKRKRK